MNMGTESFCRGYGFLLGMLLGPTAFQGLLQVPNSYKMLRFLNLRELSYFTGVFPP